MKTAVVAIIAIMVVISGVAQPTEGVSCGEVNGALAACIIYLRGHEGSPSRTCCDGVRAVKAMAETSTAAKRACCSCVKAAASRYADLKDQAAQDMPAKCGVQLDVPVSRNVDCDKY